MGLGLTNDKNHNLNRRYFSEYLQKYNMDPDNIHELVFSKDFTKEERATLHTYLFLLIKHSVLLLIFFIFKIKG